MNNVTRVIPLRVRNEIADYIDIKCEETGLSRGKLVEKIVESYRNMETICIWSDITADNLCQMLNESFMNGEITIKDGKIN